MPPAKIAKATTEPDITLLLVMGKPPAATITGGDDGLARKNAGATAAAKCRQLKNSVKTPAEAGVDFALCRT
jgi:hypothetical protein